MIDCIFQKGDEVKCVNQNYPIYGKRLIVEDVSYNQANYEITCFELGGKHDVKYLVFPNEIAHCGLKVN